MQIEVIDDRSTDDLGAQTVGRVGGGRVAFHLTAQIRGIEGSRGHRLGRGLLAPARLLRKLWRCFH